MSITIAIPTPLRGFTGGRDAVDVSGTTVGEVLDGLLTAHSGLKRHLVQDDGRLALTLGPELEAVLGISGE